IAERRKDVGKLRRGKAEVLLDRGPSRRDVHAVDVRDEVHDAQQTENGRGRARLVHARGGRYHGMDLGLLSRMDKDERPTVEQSLCGLSEAIGKATEDLQACRMTIDQARADIASRSNSISRDVVRDAEKVVGHLRETDESLQEVLKDLSER